MNHFGIMNLSRKSFTMQYITLRLFCSLRLKEEVVVCLLYCSLPMLDLIRKNRLKIFTSLLWVQCHSTICDSYLPSLTLAAQFCSVFKCCNFLQVHVWEEYFLPCQRCLAIFVLCKSNYWNDVQFDIMHAAVKALIYGTHINIRGVFDTHPVIQSNESGAHKSCCLVAALNTLLCDPCQHPLSIGCSMDVCLLCSLNVRIYVRMSSFWTFKSSCSVHVHSH